MRLGVLFSGGKDSTLALAKAMEKNEIACLVTLISENKESYMFHTVNLDLQCLNPLWKKDQKELLEEIVEEDYKAIISGVFAYPLDRSWLGREIDREMIDRLVKLQEKYGINPAGEGGEIETNTLDAPPF